MFVKTVFLLLIFSLTVKTGIVEEIENRTPHHIPFFKILMNLNQTPENAFFFISSTIENVFSLKVAPSIYQTYLTTRKFEMDHDQQFPRINEVIERKIVPLNIDPKTDFEIMSDEQQIDQIKIEFKEILDIVNNGEDPLSDYDDSELIRYFFNLKFQIFAFLFKTTNVHSTKLFNKIFDDKCVQPIFQATNKNDFDRIGENLIKVLTPVVEIGEKKMRKINEEILEKGLRAELDKRQKDFLLREEERKKNKPAIGWFRRLINWFKRFFGMEVNENESDSNNHKMEFENPTKEDLFYQFYFKQKFIEGKESQDQNNIMSVNHLKEEVKWFIVKCQIKLDTYVVDYNYFKEYAVDPIQAYFDVILNLFKLGMDTQYDYENVVTRIIWTFRLMFQIRSDSGEDLAETRFGTNKKSSVEYFAELLAEHKYKHETGLKMLPQSSWLFLREVTTRFFNDFIDKSKSPLASKAILKYFNFFSSKLNSKFTNKITPPSESLDTIAVWFKSDDSNFLSFKYLIDHKTKACWILTDPEKREEKVSLLSFYHYAKMNFRFFDIDKVTELMLSRKLVSKWDANESYEILFQLISSFLTEFNNDSKLEDFPGLFDAFLDSELVVSGNGLGGYYLVFKMLNLYGCIMDRNTFKQISFTGLKNEKDEVIQKCKNTLQQKPFAKIKSLFQTLAGNELENLFSDSFDTEQIFAYKTIESSQPQLLKII